MCAGGQPRSDCGSVRQPWATWSGYLGYQVYRYYGTPLASNNPSAAARFSPFRPGGDVEYKPRRCRVQVRAMRSTSGADAEYKLRNPRPALKFTLVAGAIFRYDAAVRSARFRGHRFCLYTCMFNAHVFVMSNPAAIPIRAAGATQLDVGAVRTFHQGRSSNFVFIGAAVFWTASESAGWDGEGRNG